MQPLYKNDNAINFLKTEFGENYQLVINKIIDITIEHADPIMYFEYKNYALVGTSMVWDINEYEKWLNAKNIKTKKINILDFFYKLN